MSNQAAWIKEKLAKPFVVDKAELYKPGPNEVLIKNAAVSINPIDWVMQDVGILVGKYPIIFGCDVAGEVVQVGSSVTKFKKGQRVMGHAAFIDTQEPRDSGFQLYSIIKEAVTAPIPDSMSFENAVVLPLALSTAATGLYQKQHLNLPLPSKDPKPLGKTLLVWGGATSVGAAAIQLATASGLDVVSTASKKNHDYVKSLGAKVVLDYNSPNIVDDVVAAFKSSTLAGVFDCVSKPESFKLEVEIGEKLGGCRIAPVLPYQHDLLSGKVTADKHEVHAFKLYRESSDISDAVWQNWVPEALADGRLKAKPDPTVFGTGLSQIQGAVDRHKQGVSATKIVVKL